MARPKKKIPTKAKKPWADFIDAKSLFATILGGLLVLVVSLVSTYVMEESRAKADQIRQAGLDLQTADSLAREESSLPEAIRYYKDALSKLSKKDDTPYYADAETGLALCYLKQAQKNNDQQAAQQAVDSLKEVIGLLKKLYGKNPQDAERIKVSRIWNAMGDSLSVLSEIREKVPYLEECIELYTAALNASQGQKDSELSATIQMNLGFSYMRLAEEKDRQENSKLALAADEEAIKYFKPEDHPLQYIKLTNSIGKAFQNLSESLDPDTSRNIQESLAAYYAATKVASLDNYPEDYAITQMNIGEALAGWWYQFQNNRANLAGAIRAFHNSLLVFKEDNYPYYYATVQNDIAKIYSYQFQLSKRADFLDQALDAEKEASGTFKPDVYPYNYFLMKLVMGNIFGLYASVKDPKTNYSMAINSYIDALNVCTLDKYPNDYAKLNYDLALVHGNLALLQDREQNALTALKFNQEALKVWTVDKYPLDYAHVQLSLGHDFFLLSKTGGEKAQSDALRAYAQAAEVYKSQNLPQDYQMVLKLMGRLKNGRP